MYVCCIHVSVYIARVWRAEEGETGVMDDCEQFCGCLDSSLGPPREQQVLLTAALSLQPRTLSPRRFVIQAKEGLTGLFSCLLAFWKCANLCYPRFRSWWQLLHRHLERQLPVCHSNPPAHTGFSTSELVAWLR